MSKPRYRWWGYIRNVIRAYPELKKEYDALHQQSITANISGMPGSGSVSRGTESIAIRELPRTKQREYEAVRKAIDFTRRMPNGDLRLRVIDLVFWKERRKLLDAGESVGYAYKTARTIQSTFIKLTADAYGYDLEESDKLLLEKLLADVKRGSGSQKNAL